MFDIWPVVGLIGLLVLGVILVVWADRWRKKPTGNPTHSLDHYREMFKQGMINEQEFERIERQFGDSSDGTRVPPPTSQHPSQPEDSCDEN